MPLSHLTVNQEGQELKTHGTIALPIAIYNDDLLIEPVPYHWHNELEAFVVHKGQSLVKINNETITLNTNDAFFINSGVLHACFDLSDTHCQYHSLVFHHRLISGSLESVFYHKYIEPIITNTKLPYLHFKSDNPWHLEIINIIDQIYTLIKNNVEDYELEVRHLLTRMIYLINKHQDHHINIVSNQDLKASERIKIMLEYIHDHYNDKITTQDLMDVANISESEVLRVFHKTINKTPIQYLKEYRILKACELLKDTNQKTIDIAFNTGFNDASYFNKIFKQTKGLTPLEYRTKHRKKQKGSL